MHELMKPLAHCFCESVGINVIQCRVHSTGQHSLTFLQYQYSSIANPSANVVDSHPVTDSSTQLSWSGQHRHHFASVTSVAAFQRYLSLSCWSSETGEIETTQVCHHCGSIQRTRGLHLSSEPIRETLSKCSKSLFAKC